jgi:pentatricopeptide repeat protein
VFLRLHKVGFGNNMCVYSTLVSAYGRNCKCSEALKVFQSMKKAMCKPNLITYNTIIVAHGKGGVDLKQMLNIFEEM